MSIVWVHMKLRGLHQKLLGKLKSFLEIVDKKVNCINVDESYFVNMDQTLTVTASGKMLVP